MSVIHGSRVFADWVLGVLAGDGLWADLGKKPANVPAGNGWAVVYPISGGVTTGTLEHANEDVTPHIQVTSVGLAAEQALWVADRARALLLGAWPANLSDGRRVIFASTVFGEILLQRDDDSQPPVFYAIDRFIFRTAPGVASEEES